MFIIKLKDSSVYFTDNLDKTDAVYKFETQTKKGKTQKHELAFSEVAEIVEQDGEVADTYKEE